MSAANAGSGASTYLPSPFLGDEHIAVRELAEQFRRKTVADHLAAGFFQREFEGRQVFSRYRRSGTLFMKLGSPAAAGCDPASVAIAATAAAAVRNSRRCGSDISAPMVGCRP